MQNHDPDASVTFHDPSIAKKRRFPWTVILIVFNESCERFAYSGLRAFLTLYLKQKLNYTDDEATELYHLFTTAAYAFPIVGAILADVYFGKFKTILYLMIVYVMGNILIALTAVPPLAIPGRAFTIIGLFLVAFGTGGIKPCVSAFGGDQFKLPDQEKQLSTFFTLLYFSLCASSFLAKTISPLLRSEISCFGDKDCFSVAFAAPGLLIILSIILFQCGKKYYVIKKPTGNILVDVTKCIYTALTAPKKTDELKKPKHWLDKASDKYDRDFIADIKRTLKVFLLFTPITIFWSCIDQLGSRWTLQAVKMDGEFRYLTIRPDQTQVLCPITIMILIPIFKYIVYPTLGKYNILTNLLHRIFVGCILASLSFVSSGLLEMRLEKEYTVQPGPGVGHFRIFNGFHNCRLHLGSHTIEPLEVYTNMSVNVDKYGELYFDRTLECGDKHYSSLDMIHVEEGKSFSYFYKMQDNGIVGIIKYEDKNDKSKSGYPLARILVNIGNSLNSSINLLNRRSNKSEIATDLEFTKLTDVYSSNYDLLYNSEKLLTDFRLKTGGVYTLMVDVHQNNHVAKVITLTPPNSLSVLWIMPQMVIMSMGELLLAVSGLEFAFKEAPISMKSVVQGYWLLLDALGNIVIVLVTVFGAKYTQTSQTFFYAGLMAAASFMFYLLARRHEKNKGVEIEGAELRLLQGPKDHCKDYMEIEEVTAH